MFCAVDALDFISLCLDQSRWRWGDLNGRPKRIFRCRKVGLRRYAWPAGVRRKRSTDQLGIRKAVNVLTLAVKDVIGGRVNRDKPHASHIPSFRGGGRRMTTDQILLQGLQNLMKDVIGGKSNGKSSASLQAHTTSKGGGKGKDKHRDSSKPGPSKPKASKSQLGTDYGLTQALQTLTARASKEPAGLLDRLRTLIDVAEKGQLRPKKRRRKQKPTGESKHDAKSTAGPTAQVGQQAAASSTKPASRWTRNRCWNARPQDWGVRAIHRGPSSLCTALDQGDANRQLCQVTNLDDWMETLQMLKLPEDAI